MKTLLICMYVYCDLLWKDNSLVTRSKKFYISSKMQHTTIARVSIFSRLINIYIAYELFIQSSLKIVQQSLYKFNFTLLPRLNEFCQKFKLAAQNRCNNVFGNMG